MNFINPIILWFSTLLVVPVLIHFINRGKAKKIDFPSLRFIESATQKILKKFEFLQLLLLFLRLLILLLLIFAFARPVWKNYITKDDVFDNVILIDNSYSMSAKLGQSNVLDFSKEIARALIRDIDGRFSVASFNDGISKFNPYTESFQKLQKQINSIEQSYSNTALLNSMEELIEILKSKSETQKVNLYILSDFSNETDFEKVLESQMLFNSVLLVDCSDVLHNTWIKSISLPTIYKGIPARISVDIATNYSENFKLSLWVNGVKRYQNIFQKNTQICEFDYKFPTAGDFECVLNVESLGDKLEIDNKYYFNAKVREPVKVLIVEGKGGYNLVETSSFFLTRALAPEHYNTALIPKVISWSELKTTKLLEHDIVFLLDLKLNKALRDILLNYYHSGGSLALFMGSNTDMKEYNSFLSYLSLKIEHKNPLRYNENIRINALETDFNKLLGLPKDFLLKKVYKTRSLSSKKAVLTAGSIPLMWYSNNEDSAIGRFVLFTSSLDLTYGDLSLQSFFAPLIHEMVRFLVAKEENLKIELKLGSLLDFFVSRNISVAYLENKKYHKSLLNNFQTVMFPGNYSNQLQRASVNLDMNSGESALNNKINIKNGRIFGALNSFYIPYASDLPANIVLKISGQEQSKLFLILAFILLILEEFLRKYIKFHGADHAV